MNDFHKTRMGHRFYEQTVPEIARQLARLNDLLERLVDTTENRDATTQPDDADDR
ncbi:MAG: hypothetical protein GY708_21690 [Actinomycetia bacterium]|nr:hypothetical protein [Actinomycetes bacterium]